MRGAIPLLPQYIFVAWCFAKQRDNFTFTLPFHSFSVKFLSFIAIFIISLKVPAILISLGIERLHFLKAWDLYL